jgi:hypothetical protein
MLPKEIILDIKTGMESRSIGIQLAGYELANEEPETAEFQEEGHIYRIGGVIVPSVTQILAAEKIVDLDSIPEQRLNASSNFGTAVHKMCQLFDEKRLNEDTLDDNLRPYLRAWRYFIAESQLKITGIERIVASQKYMFAGTIDRTGEMKNCKYSRLAVFLKANGEYNIKGYADKSDRSVFLAALTLHNWKRSKNGK